MQKQDIAEVLAIETAATAFPWSAKNFEDSLQSGHKAWVFSDDLDNMIGFALVQRVVDEAHLLNICVKQNQQGKGFGRAILSHIIEFANSISSVLVVLEVRSSNKRAQQLYLNTGFNEMSVRKDYYPAKVGREDAVLMGLDLDLISLFSDK